MLIEILKRTPLWVFVLFFALLALGYSQSKGRMVVRGKVSILPAAMIVLSFYGVCSAFGTTPVGLTLWVLGVAMAVGIGVKLAMPRGVSFSPEAQTFSVPGSWLPLALMMIIFFIKFGVSVVLARQLPVAGEMTFIGSVSLCYGLLSGVFLARAVVILRTATSNPEAHV